MTTVFLYGPQTVGKSSRLLKIIKHDQGNDLAFSGEDDFIDNGKIQAKVTAPLPTKIIPKAVKQFQKQVNYFMCRSLIKHILVDGAQFMSINQIKWLIKFFTKRCQQIPIIFSGCLYYLNINCHQDNIIPSSKFLLKHCSRTLPVKRRCEFCHRNASRLWINQIKSNTNHTVITQDPHLVCNYHYYILNLKRTKDKS